MRIHFIQKILILFVVVLGLPSVLLAQFEEGRSLQAINSKLIGSSIAVDSTRTTEYFASTEDYAKLKNVVSFYIREVDSAGTYFKSGFTATVNFDLQLTVGGVTGAVASHVLTITYDTTTGSKYKVRSYLVLPEQAQKVKLTVTGMQVTGASGWTPLSVLQLDNDIHALQYYNTLGGTVMTADSLTGVPTDVEHPELSDELRVSWNWAHERYNLSQLEWAFIDSNMLDNYAYNLNQADNLFQHNSTRVDIEFGKENYKIPVLYPAGHLYYRVRPALRRNSGNVITGAWSTAKMFAVKGHEDSLNWQSSTSFAENQKYKTVIQYFDGSLRGRQTVTKDNSTGNTVVSETIYDLQGRPNIQILPTPTINTTIQYFRNFNRFVGQQVEGTGDLSHYDDPAKYFDLSVAGACNPSPALDTAGNSRYYSARNDWLTGPNAEEKSKFVPDAGGFAYTETRFMDDATERVRSQGGVGTDHRIGSGHETKYWYGKPSQPEMDALFGTEVGDAGHYSKNMVQDANEQVSVSYVDMHGRTIATALAGAVTNSAIDPILNAGDYPQASALITDSLVTATTNIIKDRSVESISTILVTTANTKYDFVYELDPAILSLFNCTHQQVCFDCKYDLEISIKSEDCGDTTPVIRRYNNLQLVPANQACNTSMGFSGEGLSNVKQITFSDTLSIGSYVIRKTLTINDSMFQVRRDSVLKDFLCRKQDSIYAKVYAALAASSGCGLPATSTCDSCKVQLGTFGTYRENYLSSVGVSTADHSRDSEIHGYYTADSLQCAEACGSLNPGLSTLSTIRTQMLNDVTPFSGQYAIPVDSIKAAGGLVTDYSRREAKYNIFTDKYIQGGATIPKDLFYRKPHTVSGNLYYLTEENGVDSSIHGLNENGQVLLSVITPEAFSSAFQSSWSNSLLRYHPEYSKLAFAEANLKTSYEWLDKVQVCESYQTALDSGYLNPTNSATASPYPALAKDPFFVLSANATAKSAIDKRLVNGVVLDINGNPSGPSIWQLANAAVLCAEKDSLQRPGCIMAQDSTGIDPSITDAAKKNKVWEQFKTLYLSYRNEAVLTYIDAQGGGLSTVDMDSLQAQGKQLVFATMARVAVQNNAGAAWASAMNGDTAAIRQFASLNDSTDNCRAQRPTWKARLLKCEALAALLNTELHTDSLKVDTIINHILDSMVLVCRQSVNAQQPYGASNVNPAYAGLPKNFEQVINGVLFRHGIDTAATSNYYCNPYTIDFPKPYGKNPPLFVNYTNVIDSCACTRFSELKTEAKALGYDTLNLAGSLGMNQFLITQYQDSLTTITWNGLQKCSQGLFKDTCFFTPGVDSSATTPCVGCPADTSPCGTPVLYSATYLNNTDSNNVKVNYKTSSGTYNCKIMATNLATNVLTYFTIDCGSSSDTISLPNGERYKIQISVGSNNHGTSCYDTSASHILSASVNDCKRLYTPIYLPDAVALPVFLSCGYQKPCISCATFTALTAEFRTIYPTLAAVPHLLTDSITSAQAQQNELWTRFLNYRTGFSKTTYEYLTAYQDCQGDSSCGVNAGVNHLTLTARAAPFPAEYVARVSVTLEPGFQSNNGDTYLIHINPSLDTCSAGTHATAICSSFKPVNGRTDLFTIDSLPCRDVQTQALFIAKMLFEKSKDSLIANFDSLYLAKCLGAKYREKFYVKYLPKEYHYTLYYYDQAGNLVKTLPPAAVRPNFSAAFLDSVIVRRNAGLELVNYANNLSLATNYRYNSLNQVVTQHTPDAGTSNFWYDRLGRLVVSQNAKQEAADLYSYTLYDVLGRITEVGEKPQSIKMKQDTSRSETSLQNWLSGTGIKTQITRTVYDEAYTPLATTADGISGLYQQNLRNRVSFTYVKAVDNNALPWDAASFYTYDIHGNVDTLLQDYQSGMGRVMCTSDTSKGNRFKKMVYSYDLISGKVNDVAYQPGQADQYYHRYAYDAENRLTNVQTSRDKIYWEQEAVYDYYRHGPLARTVLGHNEVQGLDYAYTIQGWLKGVNSTAVINTPTGTSFDMGQDGVGNSLVARDAFGFSLNYFTGDYTPISSSNTFVGIPSILSPAPGTSIRTGGNLFNGNIAAMAVNLPKLGTGKVYGYRYDQLNRIVRMDAFDSISNATNTFTAIRTNDYHEEVSYDPNGNIKTYLRNGTGQGSSELGMDSLTYQYERHANGQLKSNKLRYVHDVVRDANYTEDINSQKAASFSVSDVENDKSASVAGDNYAYDQIGNLIKDTKEGITSIEWTVYGKISKIEKGGSTITYSYDASGNRISKVFTADDVAKATYYVRDASGNVMSVYTRDSSTLTNAIHSPLSQNEIHLYGSSRLGVYNVNVDVQNCLNTPDTVTTFTRGNKFFELSNHLGNVLATVSDKKLQHTTNNTSVDYYTADVITANDYYPGGMQMSGRKYQSGTESYRYGFGGQEKSSEIKGEGNSYTAEYWEYDPRLMRRWNVDPIYKNSPYEAFANNPILYIDPTGLDSIKFSRQTTVVSPKGGKFSGGGQKPSGSTSFGINIVPRPGADVFTYTNTLTTINGDGESKTTSTTKVLHPEDPNSSMGVTKGKNLYLDGLITTVRNNKDWESVGKFMDLDKGFYNYMTARNSNSKGWNEKAASMSLMEGLMPVLIQSGLGSWAGFRIGMASNGLSNSSVRLWYNGQLKNLNTQVALTEQNAIILQAQRNALKVNARSMMADRKAAALLNETDPIRPFSYYVEKYMKQGYTEEGLWKKIIQGSAKPNADVNARFGLK